MGQITNTNSRDLARFLASEGIFLYYQSTVGDNEDRLAEVLRTALSRSDLILLCGGLGPTSDDITRETVAKVLGLPLEKDHSWEKHLEEFFKRRGRPFAGINRRQAMVPRGGRLLPNHRGTAPGLYIHHKLKHIFLLPGPPRELVPLLQEQVMPLLGSIRQGSGEKREFLVTKILRVTGIGEGEIEEKLSSLISTQGNPTIAPLAKGMEVHLRLTARAPSAEEGRLMIAEKKDEICRILKNQVYGEDEETLELVVARLLWQKKLTLALAESCTGGLITHRLTNIPNSSAFLLAGLVTYSNEAKVKLLGVEPAVLAREGAVSREVALAMARGVKDSCQASMGLAVTGIAGPGGATKEKPVGLVHIALAGEEGKFFHKKHLFWGERELIKLRTSQAALDLLRNYLMRGDVY